MVPLVPESAGGGIGVCGGIPEVVNGAKSRLGRCRCLGLVAHDSDERKDR